MHSEEFRNPLKKTQTKNVNSGKGERGGVFPRNQDSNTSPLPPPVSHFGKERGRRGHECRGMYALCLDLGEIIRER